jgi:hypothetical protein
MHFKKGDDRVELTDLTWDMKEGGESEMVPRFLN